MLAHGQSALEKVVSATAAVAPWPCGLQLVITEPLHDVLCGQCGCVLNDTRAQGGIEDQMTSAARSISNKRVKHQARGIALIDL